MKIPGNAFNTASGYTGISCKPGAREAASYGNHFLLWRVQAVQALPGVSEIMALDKDLFFLQPVQCIAHGP